MDLAAMLTKVVTKNGLIFAFVIIGITNLIAYRLAGLTKGRIHGSADFLRADSCLFWRGRERIGDDTAFCWYWFNGGRDVSRLRHRFYRVRCGLARN